MARRRPFYIVSTGSFLTLAFHGGANADIDGLQGRRVLGGNAVVPGLKRTIPNQVWLEEYADKLSINAALAVAAARPATSHLRRTARPRETVPVTASVAVTETLCDDGITGRRRPQSATGEKTNAAATSQPLPLLPDNFSQPLSGRELRALALAQVCTRCGGLLAARTKQLATQPDDKGEMYLRCRSCRARFRPEDFV